MRVFFLAIFMFMSCEKVDKDQLQLLFGENQSYKGVITTQKEGSREFTASFNLEETFIDKESEQVFVPFTLAIDGKIVVAYDYKISDSLKIEDNEIKFPFQWKTWEMKKDVFLRSFTMFEGQEYFIGDIFFKIQNQNKFKLKRIYFWRTGFVRPKNKMKVILSFD